MKTPAAPTPMSKTSEPKPMQPKAQKPKAKSNPISRLGAYAHPKKKK